jgi:hippurate hydrolase
MKIYPKQKLCHSENVMSNYWLSTIAAVQTLRRDLHAHPEPSWHEVRTAEMVRSTLSQLGITWRQCARTGTIATLHGSSTLPKSKAKYIALRGDIDGLPIIEQTGRDWSSTQSGCMHACGHDGHTATLLASARLLKHNDQSLTGPVTLLFQPAKVGGHGAREMINEGALDGIDEIYGWHNWKGGHASQPELRHDPLLAASVIALALQQMISSRLAPHQAPCHSPHYEFNDRLIPLASNLFSQLCGVTTPERPAQTI